MKKEDLIYKDEEYEIYKKHTGAIGSFVQIDCLELIDIAIEELEKWDNAGLFSKKDYERILGDIIKRLKMLSADNK